MAPLSETAHHPNVYAAVVSLKRAIARREVMEVELTKAKITYEMVDAIDVRETDESVLRAGCKDEGPWGSFALQNMACTLSHELIWQKFLKTDAEFAFVFEDDVFIAPDLGEWLADTSWWPKDADMVKFERWRSDGLYVILGSDLQHHNGRDIQRMYSRQSGSAGYMLTRDAAEKFLARRPYDVSIDQLLFNAAASPAARKMKIYQVQPAMIEQGNDPIPAQALGAHRHRPTGMALVRQKLWRGINEIRFPLPVLARVLTGRARPTQIRFEHAALSGTMQSNHEKPKK
ncbi:MAG: glycosyltransferase family 25 protein [Paracoccaceae bacterium]